MDTPHPRCPSPPALDAGNRVIAVLRAEQAAQYPPVIEHLVLGGVRLIELTLTTGGVLEQLAKIRSQFGADTDIGVGTVTTLAEAERALDGGAQFLVTPIVNISLVTLAARRAVPIFPGGLSPSELYANWQAGATAVKVFPASAVGPGYFGQVRGPFPDIQLIPSGGVGIEDAAQWMAAGALAVSLGGPLVQDAFDGGSLAQLRDRARRVCDLVDEATTCRSVG